MDARRAAELAARNSYGRLVAYLAAQTRDVMAAEDALGDAFLTALKTWTEHGVPKNPEAWLLVAAKHRSIDLMRRAQVGHKVLNICKPNELASSTEPSFDAVNFPDDRLKLLFTAVCRFMRDNSSSVQTSCEGE
jgi:predicted RNA polymerase sigma factor